MAKEFLDSSARINYTKEQSVSQGFKKAIRWGSITAAGFLGLSQVLAGCSQKEAVSVIAAPNPPEATATFVPGGVGGGEPIPTYPSSDPRAERLNPIIDRINDPKKAGTVTNDERNQVTLARGADNTATAQAGGKIPPEGTKTPEKAVHCGILPDEFCNSGEPVIRPGRNIVTSIRFKAPPGTPISSLFAAKVSTVLGKEAQEGKKAVEPNTTLTPLDKTIPPFTMKGDLEDQLVDTNDKGVSEGDPVAKVGPSGEINVSWSAYNPANRSSVSDQESVELLKRFFPEAMQKQPVIVPLASAGGWGVAEPKFPAGG